jgi:hypothetical protein
MAKAKLTERLIAKLAAPTESGRQEIVWDVALHGFGILCSGASTKKSYVVQRDIDGRTRRVTVAAVEEVTLDQARKEAGQILFDLRRGRDPKATRRGAITLRQALDHYLAVRKLRAPSQRLYRKSIEAHLRTWLDLPLTSITPQAVEKRHKAIADEVAKGGRYNGATIANVAMRVLRILWNHAKQEVPSLPDNPVRLRQAQK